MANQSIIIEFWEFLKFRKRYWLLPIVIVLLLFSGLIIFTESSALPHLSTPFFRPTTARNRGRKTGCAKIDIATPSNFPH